MPVHVPCCERLESGDCLRVKASPGCLFRLDFFLGTQLLQLAQARQVSPSNLLLDELAVAIGYELRPLFRLFHQPRAIAG